MFILNSSVVQLLLVAHCGHRT